MIVKQDFELLRRVPNTLNLSHLQLRSLNIPNGIQKTYDVLKLSNINHFAKNRVFKLLTDDRTKGIHIINYKDYVLPVSYNTKTNTIIVNLAPFGIDDITTQNPGERNLFACIVYGICLQDLIKNKISVKYQYGPVISTFLTTIFVKWFGKDYGLLGRYSTEIHKLKFLITLYILGAFFGIIGTKAYSIATSVAGFNYRDIIDDLNKYNFRNILDLIKSLSEFNVMPGINKYSFTSKVLKFASVNFLPALEDLSRFFSVITTSSISGTTIVPTYLYKWNESEFNKLLEISKMVFRK